MCKAMDHVEKYQNGEDTDYHGLASDAWDIGKGLLWSRLDLLNKLFWKQQTWICLDKYFQETERQEGLVWRVKKF